MPRRTRARGCWKARERLRLRRHKLRQRLPEVIKTRALEPLQRKVTATERGRGAEGNHGREHLLLRCGRALDAPKVALDVGLEQLHVAGEE